MYVVDDAGGGTTLLPSAYGMRTSMRLDVDGSADMVATIAAVEKLDISGNNIRSSR